MRHHARLNVGLDLGCIVEVGRLLHNAGGARNGAEVINGEGALLVLLDVLLEQLLLLALDLFVVQGAALGLQLGLRLLTTFHFEYLITAAHIDQL